MITAEEIKEYRTRLKGIKKIGEFKKLGREIRDRHKLTDMQAIAVLNTKNVDSILELLEVEK